MDPGVSHTLGRRFFWNENVLWKEDFEGRKVTAALAGRDLIVDTEAVGRYLCCGNLSGKSTPSLGGVNGSANANGTIKNTSNLNIAPLIDIDEEENRAEDRIDVDVIGSEMDHEGFGNDNGNGNGNEVDVDGDVHIEDDEEWKYREWKGVGTEVLWFGNLDHAQVFDNTGIRRRLVEVVRVYCEGEGVN